MDALECDLAETYHIYEMRELPVKKVALFSLGLSDNSRIKKKMSGLKVDLNTLLLAKIYDELQWIHWSKTKDGMDGKNPPEFLAPKFVDESMFEKDSDYDSFETVDDFKNSWQEIVERIKDGQ